MKPKTIETKIESHEGRLFITTKDENGNMLVDVVLNAPYMGRVDEKTAKRLVGEMVQGVINSVEVKK